jgi:hypothetical protein
MNFNDIPPDDFDDVVLSKIVKEAVMFYRMESERGKG